MPKFIHLILCFENWPPLDIVTLQIDPSLHMEVVSVAPKGGLSSGPHFKYQGFK